MRRLFIILACLALALAGCAYSASPAEPVPEGEETVTLDWYINFSWYNTPWGVMQ